MHKGLRAGHLLALGGSAVLAGSLWMPWYSIALAPAVREALDQQATRIPPALSEMAKGLVQALPSEVHGTGWQAFGGADVAMLVGALLTVLAIVLATGVAGTAARVTPAAAGRVSLVLGVGLGGLVLVKILNPVGPDELVSVDTGAWLALGGCVLMAAGGLLSAHDHVDPQAAPAPHRPSAVPGWSAASVAPPPHH